MLQKKDNPVRDKFLLGKVWSSSNNNQKEFLNYLLKNNENICRVKFSWEKIFKNGNVDEDVLESYDRIIDGLLENGIKPMITICDGSLPEYIRKKYGGWKSSKVIEEFNNYSILLYKRYGERVKYWITIEEQNKFIELSLLEMNKEALRDLMQQNHLINLANAKSIISFRKYVRNGMVGPSLACKAIYPSSSKAYDVLSAENMEDVSINWWTDAYIKGAYPLYSMSYYERLNIDPIIEDYDFELLEKGKPDFIGVNYCGSVKIKSGDKYFSLNVEEGNDDLVGLKILLRKLTCRYNLPVFINENYIEKKSCKSKEESLKICFEAISEGVELLGYCSSYLK